VNVSWPNITQADDCFATTIMTQPTKITQFIFGQPLRRKDDADYRRGWNSFTGAPIPTPQVQSPTSEQGVSAGTPQTEDDMARHLNEQELKRLQRR
jgi:hypothetical protein